MQNRIVQFVIEVYTTSENFKTGPTLAHASGTGQNFLEVIQNAVMARTGLKPSIVNYDEHRLTMYFLGNMPYDVTPNVIENAIFMVTSPNFSTAIVWGHLDKFPTYYSTHLSCNFDRTRWMPLLRQLMGKFQGAADGTVNDMIIDTSRQWEFYGTEEYTPQEREALEQNWVECKTNGRIRPPGIIGREYRDGGYVPTVKVFEG